jgi:hypothetical protein
MQCTIKVCGLFVCGLWSDYLAIQCDSNPTVVVGWGHGNRRILASCFTKTAVDMRLLLHLEAEVVMTECSSAYLSSSSNKAIRIFRFGLSDGSV